MPFPHPILITGIGRDGQAGQALARELAARGARLLVVDRDEAQARARADEVRALGGAAEAYAADLSDPAGVDALAASVRRDAGEALSAVVHAAGGFGMSGPVAESDLASWDRMLAINLTTAYLTTRAFLPLLRPARGAMIYFASAAVLPGASGPRMSAYAAAKAGVLALMHAVAEEERAAGVRANALAPTAIRTAANLADMGDNPRYVTREDLARVVAWLCGEESRAVTGQVIGL